MLPPCDLSSLADNLFALQNFDEMDPDKPKTATSAPFIDEVVCWFNDIIGLGPDALARKLSNTLVKVRQEFLLCLDYQDSLETTLHLPQDIRSSSCLTDSERSLLEVGTHCLFLTTHKMLVDPSFAIENLQKLYKVKIQSSFLDDGYLEKLERFTRRYAMTALAALLELPYPICCFSKVLEGKKLDSLDVKVLSKWTKAIEKHKSHISVHLLHTALTSVVEGMLPLLERSDRALAKNVAVVEWRLYFGLCDLLGEDDHVYLDFVKNTVYPGVRLECNERQMLVGNPVLLSLPEGMHARLYELPEDPSSLLFVGCNPAVLGIWQVNAEHCAQGCPPVLVKDQDRHMRYFVIDRLSEALVDMQWKTTTREIDQSDRPYLEQLVRFLSWLAENPEVTPRNLRADYLFFQQQDGRVAMRALMPFDMPGPGDYAAIEQFVRECAKGNRWVCSYLMQASTLNQHDRPIAIRKIARNKLFETNQDVTVQQMLSREKITDPKYKDQVESMVQGLIELRNVIYVRMSPRLQSNTMQQELKSRLSEALLAHQQEMGFSSYLDPHLLELEGMRAFEQAFIAANPVLFNA